MGNPALTSDNYINRELSWLEFNDRVLRQAHDTDNPLFERMKFMSIVCSNLDEFFMVRAAGLRDRLNSKKNTADPAGMTAKQQLNALSRRVRTMMSDLYRTYFDMLLPELSKHDIHILTPDKLTVAQKAYCEGFFESALYPVLTPLAIDRSHPFPFIVNRSINLAVMALESSTGGDDDDEEEYCFATVQAPSNFPRLLKLTENNYIPVEEVIRLNIGKLFPGFRIIDCVPYRITRSGDLTLDEDAADDLLTEIKRSLKLRRSSEAIRLEIESGAEQKLVSFLRKSFKLEKRDVYEITGPISLTFLLKELYNLGGFDALRYAPFTANVPPILRDSEADIFEQIKQGDILLHHPFDSFEPVVRLLRQAAEDEGVVAIKQTLYRVSRHSPIIEALIRAAENGKQVTALVELKARFDEENNITYGEELVRKGVNVVYGVENLKTHSKITLVVRRENNGVRQYLHLGTGNYNDVTATQYTDYGLLTCDESLGSDATAFFNSITGFFRPPELTHLVMAPHSLRSTFCELLAQERKRAANGEGGEFYGKMNSLSDPDMIKELYKTAAAGVKIRLLVRGICCLDPSCPDAAGNIEVRSIVGRFLEHTRVYIFGSGERRRIFLSSADLMTRNLSRRVELMFPLLDGPTAERVAEESELYWTDNVKARVMTDGGKYCRVEDYKPPVSAAPDRRALDLSDSDREIVRPVRRKAEKPVNAQEVLIERARAALIEEQ